MSVNDTLAGWVSRNVPPGIRFLTDGAPGPRGYPAASVTDPDVDWRHDTYLVAASPPDDSMTGTLAQVWQYSVPVAVFGGTQIRMIVATTSPEQLRRDRDTDRADRLRAGGELLHNPAVLTSPGSAAILASGGLDMRAAVVLSVLGAQQHINVADVGVDPAEAAAGMPARSLTVYTADQSSAVRVVRGLASALAPDRIDFGEYGAIQLHWPLSVAAVPSIR